MKFSQRMVVIAITLGCVLLFSTTLNIFILWKSSSLTVKAPFENLVSHIFRHAARKSTVDKDEEWKSVEDMKETLDILKSHLIVMRKDLSVSNASGSTNSRHNVESSQLLYEHLKDDPNFLKKRRMDKLSKLVKAFTNKDAWSKRPHIVGQNGQSSNSSQTRRPLQTMKPPPEKLKIDNHMVSPKVTMEMVGELQEMVDTVLKKRKHKKKKGQMMRIHKGSKLKPWQMFHNSINQYELYGEFEPAVDQLVKDLTYDAVVDLEEIDDKGTQIKLVLNLNNGGKALFKPMRFSKDAEANPDHYIFDDYERHHAEIAAFHLDRVLNFRRVPPVSGRYVNLTRDIEHFASRKLRKTFFTSPAKNRCFHGICHKYCESGQAVCGHPHVVEGSMAVWLPERWDAPRINWANPWAQTYSFKHDTVWRNDSEYCAKIKAEPPYDHGRRLLDVMDMAVFDFLTGNMDRHSYHTFKDFGNYTFPLLYDNGRGFGRPHHDEIGLLAAVQQCCMVRVNTLNKLLTLHQGPDHLSDIMRQSLSKDVLSPVLNKLHLEALDRRLDYVIESLYKCGVEKGNGTKPNWDAVILDDGF